MELETIIYWTKVKKKKIIEAFREIAEIRYLYSLIAEKLKEMKIEN